MAIPPIQPFIPFLEPQYTDPDFAANFLPPLPFDSFCLPSPALPAASFLLPPPMREERKTADNAFFQQNPLPALPAALASRAIPLTPPEDDFPHFPISPSSVTSKAPLKDVCPKTPRAGSIQSRIHRLAPASAPATPLPPLSLLTSDLQSPEKTSASKGYSLFGSAAVGDTNQAPAKETKAEVKPGLRRTSSAGEFKGFTHIPQLPTLALARTSSAKIQKPAANLGLNPAVSSKEVSRTIPPPGVYTENGLRISSPSPISSLKESRVEDNSSPLLSPESNSELTIASVTSPPNSASPSLELQSWPTSVNSLSDSSSNRTSPEHSENRSNGPSPAPKTYRPMNPPRDLNGRGTPLPEEIGKISRARIRMAVIMAAAGNDQLAEIQLRDQIFRECLKKEH